MHRRKTAACRPLPAAISVWCKEKLQKLRKAQGLSREELAGRISAIVLIGLLTLISKEKPPKEE